MSGVISCCFDFNHRPPDVKVRNLRFVALQKQFAMRDPWVRPIRKVSLSADNSLKICAIEWPVSKSHGKCTKSPVSCHVIVCL